MPLGYVDVYGVRVKDLPENWQGLEVVVLVKALNEDGKVCTIFRYSENLMGWEAIGLLRVAEAAATSDMLDDMYSSEEIEEDEEPEDHDEGD